MRGDVADAARMGKVGGVHVRTGVFLANPASQERRGIDTTGGSAAPAPAVTVSAGSLGYFTIFTPRRACAAKGLSDCSWTGLYNYIYSVCKKFFKTQKILTFRSPFQHRKASLPIQWPPVQLMSWASLRGLRKSC